jgi:hypothetical protein
MHSCGEDKNLNRPAHPENCTYGAKQPLYWYQKERNNMFEGTYTPPLYNDLYHFLDGAQNDIFENSTSPDPAAPASANLIANPTQTSSHTSTPAATSSTSSGATKPSLSSLSSSSSSSSPGSTSDPAAQSTPYDTSYTQSGAAKPTTGSGQCHPKGSHE